MKITRLLPFVALLFLAACDGEGVVRPPQVEVKFVNAAPNLEHVKFLREELDSGWATDPDGTGLTLFAQGRGRTIDSGQYDFHLEYAEPGASQFTRLTSLDETLDPTKDYAFIAVAPGGNAELLRVVNDNIPASDTTSRFTFVHAAYGQGPLDVYMEEPGPLPAGAVPKGTLNYGPDPVIFEMPSGSYWITLTTPGDPTSIYYISGTVDTTYGQEELYVVSDAGGEGFASVVVTRVRSNSLRIGQLGLPGRVRVINGIDDRLPRDVLLDGDAMAPIFDSAPFGEPTPYTDIAVGLHTLSVTPEDMTGTLEASFEFTGVVGRYVTALYGGDSVDGVSTRIVLEDNRPVDGQATVRIYDAAGFFDYVAVYIEPPGTDTTTATARAAFVPPNITGRLRFVPGDYEITIRDLTTGTIVAGPEPITLEDRGVYGLLLLNSLDGNTIDISRFEGFPP